MSALACRNLIKRYGDVVALNGLSLDIHRGECFGMLGPNGAGKTTTVEIAQGLRRADGGTVRVFRLDPQRDGETVRRLIGSQLQAAGLPARLRVGEALNFFARLHPDPRPVDELIDEWQLGPLVRRHFDSLSGGERQRLFVALALVGRPRLVFLDELTQNLDPVGRRHTWDVVRRIRESGTTVVLVTHDVEEAERLCDRIVVLHRGRVVAEGPPAVVAAGPKSSSTVTFTDAGIDARAIEALPGVRQVSRRGAQVTIAGSGPLLAHVGAHLVAVGRPALDLAVHRPSLEERFVRLTREGTP